MIDGADMPASVVVRGFLVLEENKADFVRFVRRVDNMSGELPHLFQAVASGGFACLTKAASSRRESTALHANHAEADGN